MNDAHLDDLWMDLLEGRLAGAEAARVRAHVDACAECQAHFRRLAVAHHASLHATGHGAAEVEGQANPSAVAAPVSPASPRRRAALAEAGLLEASPADEQVPAEVEGRILREAAAIASGAVHPTEFRKPTRDEAASIRDKEPPEGPDVEGMAARGTVPCPWCGRAVEAPRAFGWSRCSACGQPLIAR